MKSRVAMAVLAANLVLLGVSSLFADDSLQAEQIERGRYLVRIAGCNDCHTPGFGQMEGDVPESEWLKGDVMGWKGPWGTTYSPNLRLSLSRMSADDWVAFARNLRARPPMPWFNLNHMTEEDLRAIYAFVRHLEPLGEPAPTYLPPGQEPELPFAQFPVPPAD